MGGVLGRIWDNGVPDLPPALAPVRAWERERLIAAVERFRSQPKLAVRFSSFWKILDFANVDEAEAVWKALGLPAEREGTVDFLSVIMPMIVLSDQNYISKVTFLFSLCDFNSGGSIQPPEFYIGLRSMCRGLARFFPTMSKPSNQELEKLTDEVFHRIDVDRSGILELEEIVTFGYRSKALRMLMSPFPSLDRRVFEELVVFHGNNAERLRTREEDVVRADRSLTRKIKCAPDPTSGSSRSRNTAKLQARHQVRGKRRAQPWREPTVITKPRAYVAFVLFTDLASEGTVRVEDLRDLLGIRDEVTKRLQLAYSSMELEHMSSGDERQFAFTEHMRSYLSNAHDVLAGMDGDDLVSLRAFCCMLWSAVPEKEIKVCLRWCRQFQAVQTLREMLKPTSSALNNPDYDPARDRPELDIDQDDICALFDALDADGDGRLSVKELTEQGHVSVQEAERLIALWDREHTNDLSRTEILNLVFGMNQVLQREMRFIFNSAVRGHPATGQ